jgi:hypothetical protein
VAGLDRKKAQTTKGDRLRTKLSAASPRRGGFWMPIEDEIRELVARLPVLEFGLLHAAGVSFQLGRIHQTDLAAQSFERFIVSNS